MSGREDEADAVCQDGTTYAPNRGIWGLTADLVLTDGYDSGPDPEVRVYAGKPVPPAYPTLAEQIRIADLMLARWQRFRASALAAHKAALAEGWNR